MMGEFKRRGLHVRDEQWVQELEVREVVESPEGPKVIVKEARLDLVVRDGVRLWWLDFSCFHPFQGGKGAPAFARAKKWTLQQREGVKHATYRVRGGNGTRKTNNGQVVPIIANSYGACGSEALSFFKKANSVARRLGRSCANERLEPVVQSLVVFFVASGVLEAYYPRTE